MDKVHLSQRVSQDLDSFISDIGFEKVKLLPYRTKLLFYNNDFGVQVYQDPKLISIISGVMLKLRGVIHKKYMWWDYMLIQKKYCVSTDFLNNYVEGSFDLTEIFNKIN